MVDDITAVFGDVIDSYSRRQALEDGVLVDISDTAKEAGIRYPLAVTRAVWEACIEWTAADSERLGWPQDQEGRLWDICWMARCAARVSEPGTKRVDVRLHVVPRDKPMPEGQELPPLVTLKMLVGPGDLAEPVLTLMQPDED